MTALLAQPVEHGPERKAKDGGKGPNPNSAKGLEGALSFGTAMVGVRGFEPPAPASRRHPLSS